MVDSRTASAALGAVQQWLLPDAREGDEVELIIHASGGRVSLRDMAAYMELADRTYGRFDPKGLKSYVKRPSDHVRGDIEPGSVLITIPDIISQASPMAVLFLTLKYLPTGAEKMAAAYNSIEQGRLARENRKQIRLNIQDELNSSALSERQRSEVADIVDSILEAESDRFVRAQRYVGDSAVEVSIKVKRCDTLEEVLLAMAGATIPSSTGVATYRVEDVRPGKHVILTAPSRKQPSILDWEDIELVYRNRPAGTLRTVDVDVVLENPQYRHSAPMCALVLAILDPGRVRRNG